LRDIEQMKIFNSLKWFGMSSLFFAISACNSLDNSVSVVKDGAVCSKSQASGMRLVKGLNIKNTGMGVVLSDKSLKPKDDDQDDTDAFWLIRVDMGQQPSGGYGLKLLSEKLAVNNQTATFALEWGKPKPGMAQVQMLTFPCLYLKIAKGDYNRLEVVDEEGVVRHGLDLP
jgi:hypothetical protein